MAAVVRVVVAPVLGAHVPRAPEPAPVQFVPWLFAALPLPFVIPVRVGKARRSEPEFATSDCAAAHFQIPTNRPRSEVSMRRRPCPIATRDEVRQGRSMLKTSRRFSFAFWFRSALLARRWQLAQRLLSNRRPGMLARTAPSRV